MSGKLGAPGNSGTGGGENGSCGIGNANFGVTMAKSTPSGKLGTSGNSGNGGGAKGN
jgi:hypothetical protein